MEWHFSQRNVLEIDLETMNSFDPKADQYAAAAAERAIGEVPFVIHCGMN